MQPDLGAVTSELVGQIQGQARQLGLTWQVVKATVITAVSTTEITAIVDGDSVPIGMTSMIGTPQVGARVWVMIVPPGGNYITGMVTGGAGFYSARQTLTSTASSVVFSNIPTALRRIRISYVARSDNAVTVQFTQMRVNGNSGAVYSTEYGQATNVTMTAVPLSGVTAATIGLCTGASATAGIYASGQVEIQGWDQVVPTGEVQWTFVSTGIGPTVASFVSQFGGGIYSASAPYTSLTFLPQAGSFVAGSDFQLEGWPS